MKTILHKLMKKVFLITIFSPLFSAFAQAPQKMSYQAVIRNSSNALVTNTPIGMKISILQASQTGIAVYVETQTAVTNANGLVTLQIGAGIVVTGNFATISWGTNNYFIKTESDIAGGTNYSISGTSQLLSVPYALYAASGTSGPQGLQGPIGPQGPPGSALNAWSTNGNTNTTTTDFIGTTDNKPMILKANNIEVARTDPAGYLNVGAANLAPETTNSLLVKGGTAISDGNLNFYKFDGDNGVQNLKVNEVSIQSSFIDPGGIYSDVLKINPAGGNVGIGNNVNPPSASLTVARGDGVDGSAVFFGTTHASHFNYATAENTYIRGGKDGSIVLINDSHNGPVYIAGGGGDTNLGGNLSVNNTSSVNGNASFYSNINVVGGSNNGIFANTTGGFNMVPIGIFSYNLSTNIILELEGGINNDVAPILLNATATVNPGFDDTIIFNFNLNPAVTAGYTSIIAIGNPGFNSPNFVTRATLTNDNSSVQATYVIDNLVGFRFRSYGRVMVYGIK
ncbi:hypothetical protein [Flavobacterium sp.]|uniref:hypothetical protein n=1 Tax=Flavobacterium sp. TaxID=239 RepID=UPI0037507C35